MGPQYDRPLRSTWQPRAAEDVEVSGRTALIAHARKKQAAHSDFPADSRTGRLVKAIDGFVDVESAKNDALAGTLEEYSQQRLVRYKAALPGAWPLSRRTTRPSTAPPSRAHGVHRDGRWPSQAFAGKPTGKQLRPSSAASRTSSSRSRPSTAPARRLVPQAPQAGSRGAHTRPGLS